MLAINPHAGDNGLIGNEDELIIKPVINSFNGNTSTVYGPFSADTFF